MLGKNSLDKIYEQAYVGVKNDAPELLSWLEHRKEEVEHELKQLEILKKIFYFKSSDYGFTDKEGRHMHLLVVGKEDFDEHYHGIDVTAFAPLTDKENEILKDLYTCKEFNY